MSLYNFPFRILKPCIRQDFETEPPKLKLLRQINQRSEEKPIPKNPINFCYIQPKHVAQINRLAHDFFWPGIDGKWHVLEYSSSYVINSFRVSQISWFHLCGNVQGAYSGIRNSYTWLQLHRGLYFIHIYSSRMAKTWHCQIYALSSDSGKVRSKSYIYMQ